MASLRVRRRETRDGPSTCVANPLAMNLCRVLIIANNLATT